ncbi:MAG TPA: lipocalin family protein [Cyclobacteriaceae bacterium]|nr:lipocalin family protein [Cyclobacteriaceae bacterium]
MKTVLAVFLMAFLGVGQAQSIVGTWQMTEEKSCLTSQFEESDTEKELLQSFGSSSSAVAKIIKFDPKGKGEEGIFKTGKRRSGDLESFRYQLSGDELQFLDKKSGIIKERFVIDELSSITLRFHSVGKECEERTFTRVK